jgi:hypothetical protein
MLEEKVFFMLAKHISAIRKGFSRGVKPFLTHLGSKLCTDVTISPTFLVSSFFIFFGSFLLVILFSFFSSFLISTYSSFLFFSSYLFSFFSSYSFSYYSSSSYSSRIIFKLFVVLQTCILNTHTGKRYINKQQN